MYFLTCSLIENSCASALVDQSLLCSLEDTLDSLLSIERKGKVLPDCANARADLSLRYANIIHLIMYVFLRCGPDTFCLDFVPML